MKKTFGKRFISGMTSAALAASFVFGAFPGISPLIMTSSAEVVTGFSRDNSDHNMSAENTKANIRFKGPNGESVNVKTADNTYYLLVHCVGEDTDYMGTTFPYFNDGESKDAYDLIEVNADGTEWTSPAFSLWETRRSGANLWGSWQERDVVPSVVSMDGVFLKNTDPSRELTLDNAKRGVNCSPVNNIKGMELTDGGYNGSGMSGGTFTFDATGGNTVSVTIYDYDEHTKKPLTEIESSDYYLLTCLYDKGTKNTDPYKNKSGIEGWSLTQFYPTRNAESDMMVWDFVSTGADSDTIHYDPDEYTISYRVIRAAAGKEVDDLDSALRNAVDTIPNYRFTEPETNGSNTDIKVVKDDVRYELEIDLDENAKVTEDDNIYIFVEMQNTSTAYKYILEKLTLDGEVIKTVDLGNWVDSNGNPPKNPDTYNGADTKVRLLKANTDSLTVNNAVNGSNCGEIADGGFLKGYTVKYGKQTSMFDEATHSSYYTEHIVLTKAEETTGYDFRSILGEGLYYGMVIDRFEQGNHTESNYAVNYYEGNGQPNTPDISGKFGGHFYFANFVHFNDDIDEYPETSDYVNFDSHDFELDPNGKFFIDNASACCEEGAVLHFDSEDRLKETAGRDGIARIYETSDEMKGVVDPIIRNMQSVSNELAALPVNAKVTVIGNNAYISGEGYSDNAVLVVDGDEIAPYAEKSGSLHIELKGNQMVIFNFDEVTEARIDEFNYRRIGEGDYQLSTTPSNENTLEGGKNYWLDQNATRYIVWNLKSVKALDINKSTGIFLIPDEDSVTRIKGTSSGWLESAGYVNNPDGEWHFLYTDLPRNTTVISVDKKDITGKDEVIGAKLRILTADGEPVFSWESDGETHNFRLAPGDYILEETGDEFEGDDGITYKVVPSSVSFTVKADEDTSSYGCTIENVRGTERAADEDSDTGYYLYNGSQQKFTVCDAAASNTTKVTINKFDITGKEELDGAVLTVKDGDGNTVTGTPWTSAKGKKLVLQLEDGTYRLTEEQGTKAVTDEDGNEYEVINTELIFKVEDGKVISVDNSTSKDSGDGYYDVDSDTNTITVNDAKRINTTKVTINKFDITGKEELDGAILTIKDSDGNTVTGTPWTSAKGKKLVVELENGTYTLTETGETITDEDGNEYEVIDSTLTFKVENGKVTVVENDTDKDSGEGFYDVDSDTNTITVNDAKKTTKVTINKFDITGKEELDGAILTIKDSDGNTVTGTPWTSAKGKKLVVELENGTYTLTETGDTITDEDGNEYEVITSELIFRVENGKVISVDNSTSKDSGEGFYDVDSDTNTITVNDAKKTTKVTINKFDITGKEELDGAILTIKDSDGNTVTGTPWTSAKGKKLVVELENGTYTLTETGDTITDEDGNEYEVITSELIFRVENGKVISVDNSTSKDSGEGFYDVDSDTNTITVNDAMKQGPSEPTDVTLTKTDITGEKELVGAVLTIKDSKGRTVEGTPWTSGEDGRKLVVSLDEGIYTLTETQGNNHIVDDEGNEYEVVESTLTFEVKDGKVTAVINDTDKDSGEGFFNVDSDTNTITINDAKKSASTATAKVTINKTDITGENEVENAQLSLSVKGLTDAQIENIIESNEGNGLKNWSAVQDGSTFTMSWVSGSKAANIKGLVPGTYTLTETGDVFESNGVTYEVLDSEVVFVINESGKVVYRTVPAPSDEREPENSTRSYAKASGNTITICDASRTDITVSKKDITNTEEVKGAHLVIEDRAGNVIDEWDSNGSDHIVKGLANGTYVLTETAVDAEQAGSEYKIIPSSVYFTVQNGKITEVTSRILADKPENGSADGYVLCDEDENTITVCDAKKTTKVTINKFDITGKEELDGAILTIKDSDGNTVTGTPWTSAKGKKLVVELENGTYTLTETGDTITDEDGNEYEVIDSTLTFTVENGKVTVVDNSTSKDSGEGFYDVDTDSNTITVNDAKKTTKVTINKFDITGKEELDGAILTIKDSEGNTVTGTPWTSAKGKKLVVELENGTYTLTETGDTITDEDGNEYEVIDSSLTFKVENGKVTVVENDTDKDSGEGFYDVDTDSNTITVNDAKKTTKVTINKFDITGKEELDGAILTIKDSDGNTVTGTPWTSAKGKKLVVELENGTYTLTETGDTITDEDGNEYEVIDSSLTFKVENGKVTVVENDTDKDSGEGFYDVDTDSNTITVNDAKKTTKVTINKFDITGKEELDGAILTIKDSDGNTVTGTPWTSAKGKKLVVELENGTYTLTETGDTITDEDGNEYEVIDSSLTFKVENGKVTVVENDTDKDSGEGFYDVDTDSNTITVNDVKKTTKVTINKFDITGKEELDGAILTIKDSEGNTVTGTPWTSAKGKKLVVELENGTYTLTETGDTITDEDGNEYEVIDSTLTFTVENGKVTVVDNSTSKDSGEGFYDVDSDTNTITVNDAKKTTKVTINKFDITGKEELDGAILTIKDSDGNTVTGTPWTSAKGKKLVVELENGTYTLTETGDTITDEDGNEYEVIDSSLTFKVENGKVTVVENDTDKDSGEGFYDVDTDSNTITVNDAKKTTKVTINKFDITGKEELDGAILTIKDSDGNTVTGTPWTSAKGKKLVVELENGTYTLTETGDTITDEDGNEYEVIDSTLTFTVENGKVTVVDNSTSKDSGEGFYDVDTDSNTITVNDAKKISITKVVLKKTDITGTEEITGAVLTIKDSDGNTVTGTPWTSGKDGKELELELTNGTYTLTETQSDNHIVDENGNEYEVIDSTLTFKVENGKVTEVINDTNKDSNEGFYDVDSDTNTITVNDAKKTNTTKVVIKKTDITGTEEITGAVLTIKDSDGNTITGTPWTSGQDGKELVVELKDGTYTLTETGDNITDADGNEYDVIDSTLTFKVEDGKVTVVDNSTSKDSGEGFYDVDSDSNTITVNDAKKTSTTKVVIKKTDITGTEEITGAVLTIKDSDGKTVTGTPWTSGQDGKELVVELENGTYTLTETGDNITDADGNEYEVIDSTLTFKVEDGKVTVVDNSTSKDSGEGFYDVDSDSNTITVNDAKKTDDDSTPDEDSSKPDTEDDSDSAADDDSSKGGPERDDDSAKTGDDDSSSSSSSESSSSSSSTTSSKASSTSTATNNGNPDTGARVLINAAEFAAAVGLCFLAVKRRKNDEDDQ